MHHFLVIDDTSCKKEFQQFCKKQKKAILYVLSNGELQFRSNGKPSYPLARKKIAVNTTESLSLLNVDEILRCESSRNYTVLHLKDRKLVVSKTLMEFEQLLSPHNFVRIHKSHLINLNFLERYIKNEGGHVELSDGTKLPVSVRKKEFLFREIEKL